MKTWMVVIRDGFDPAFREGFTRVVPGDSMRTAIANALREHWKANRKRLTEATIKVRVEGR